MRKELLPHLCDERYMTVCGGIAHDDLDPSRRHHHALARSRPGGRLPGPTISVGRDFTTARLLAVRPALHGLDASGFAHKIPAVAQ